MYGRNGTRHAIIVAPSYDGGGGMDERPLPDLSRSEDRSPFSGPAFQVFVGISNKLNLSVEERCSLLGLTGEEYDFYTDTFSEPHSATTLSREQLERIAGFMKIFRALRTLFADDSSAIAWLKSANRDTPFAGRRPLDIACAGDHATRIAGLCTVKRYLDAWRG